MQLVVQIWNQGLIAASHERSLMVLSSAYDAVLRDVASAPPLSTWKETTSSQLIWTLQEQDIGWVVSKKQLYRITGNYNIRTKKWAKKNKALVASLNDENAFLIKGKSIFITLVDSNYTLKGAVSAHRDII